MSRGLLEEQIIFSTKPKRDYWAQYRNAQRTFLCAQGKFPNFLDKAGQQILWKSLCDIEDTGKEELWRMVETLIKKKQTKKILRIDVNKPYKTI